MAERVLIVGGGITGLSAAHYLNRAGLRATLIEKEPRLGGVIHTELVQDCLLETGPDSFLASKPAALDLIRDVGLADQVIGSNDRLRRTYIVRNGRMVPLPADMTMMVPSRLAPLAATPLLSWPAKLRMALEVFRRPAPPRPDRSVADFILDHYGREALDYLTEPLLAGVFGGDPRLLSAQSVLPRFTAMESEYGSLTRGVIAAPKPPLGGTLFRSLKGGLSQLIDKLAPEADILHGEAETIERHGPGYRVRVNGGWLEADRIFLAAPAYAAGRLLQNLHPPLAELLQGIAYNSSVTMALIYQANSFPWPAKGFGFLVPKLERKRLKACTWVKNKFDYRIPAGKFVLRCFFGADSISLSDAELTQTAQQELREIAGVTVAPAATHITRWPSAMAQYNVGHAARLAQIEALLPLLPGIHLGGNGYHGIGIPDCIHSGKTAAANIVKANLPPVP